MWILPGDATSSSFVLARLGVLFGPMALLSTGADTLIGSGQLVEFEIRQIFYVDHSVFGLVYCVDKLVQFQVNGSGIAVLRVLDEKYHQKGDNRRASIDDQLPGVGKVEDGAGSGPDQDDTDCRDKCPA